MELTACPICHREPVLAWHHTQSQAPDPVPKTGKVYPDKHHPAARCVYACMECGMFTKPQSGQLEAQHAWNRGRWQ